MLFSRSNSSKSSLTSTASTSTLVSNSDATLFESKRPRASLFSLKDTLKMLGNSVSPTSSHLTDARKESGLEALARLRQTSGAPSVQAYYVKEKEVKPKKEKKVKAEKATKSPESGLEALERLRKNSGHPSVQAYHVR
ncbi:hypothetical protein MNV49_007386 [Pseudohyphozyma bogoriensis]|nr:hypothetical protein MNV49_007386 [Pseudohyphozyma bogoriensis]